MVIPTAGRRLSVLVGVLALVLLTPFAAHASDWDEPFDTDSIARSTTSQKAWTSPGSFSWQYEDSSAINRDQRAHFTARLRLDGTRSSCARLRVHTFVGGSLSKRFPADRSKDSGYYTYCQADGTGSTTFSGTDVNDRSIWNTDLFTKATVSLCYTRNRATPPGGDCYNFTVRPGD